MRGARGPVLTHLEYGSELQLEQSAKTALRTLWVKVKLEEISGVRLAASKISMCASMDLLGSRHGQIGRKDSELE